MTHYEYQLINKPSTPCHPAHMTFGGKCLNCGYEPDHSVSIVGFSQDSK